MKKFIQFSLFIFCLKLQAQTLSLVKDLCLPTCDYAIFNFQEAGGKLYFYGAPKYSTGGTGYPSLWVTDGTTSGTTMISENTGIGGMTSFNNKLYFWAANVNNEPGIYYTDGTPAGTGNLITFPNGSINSSSIVSSGNQIFFFGYTITSGMELWRSDGTAQGTRMVKEIRPGATGLNVIPMQQKFTNFYSSSDFLETGNKVYFFDQYNSSTYLELWVSDGTNSGTYLLADSCGKYGLPNSFNNKFCFFKRKAGSEGLFITDGTISGTHSLFSNSSSRYIGSSVLLTYNHFLYFSVSSVNNGIRLYKTDGITTDSTTILQSRWFRSPLIDLFSSLGGVQHSQYSAADNKIYFIGQDSLSQSGSGSSLYQTDLTISGTKALHAFFPYNFKGVIPQDWSSAIYNGKLYVYKVFDNSAQTHSKTYELWESDGTASGTIPFLPSFTLSSIDYMHAPLLFNFNGALYLNAHLSIEGYELWRYGSSWNAIGEKSAEEYLTVYPNPVSTTLQIQGDESPERIDILDFNGRLIFQDSANPVDVSALESGLYWAKVFTKKGIATKKFLKMQ